MSTIAAKLSKLKNANYRETEILALPDGTQLILSTLTGDEDLELAEYLNEFVQGAFGHHTKLETLAHSIKWIQGPDDDSTDLRGVLKIETGDKLDNGTSISRRKHVFLRPIVRSWPDVVIDSLFTKYAILMEDLEKDISKGIKVELGPDAMRVKILSLAEDVKNLIEDAKARGVEIDAGMLDFRVGTFKAGDEDELLTALEGQQPVEPEEKGVHHFDEQLERERAENPEVYPVGGEGGGVIEETPRRIRQ